MMRTIMRKHKFHHPKTLELEFKMKEKGKGVIDIIARHEKLILKLRNYFYGKGGNSELQSNVPACSVKMDPASCGMRGESGEG